MFGLHRPFALALLLAILSTHVHAQAQHPPRRVRADRAHQAELRARAEQQQLGAVVEPAQLHGFAAADAGNGMLPVVGWAGEELEEGGSSWDLIESEADAAEDDASVEQMAAQVNSKASWGRRAHLRKRAGPRTKPSASSTTTWTEATPILGDGSGVGSSASESISSAQLSATSTWEVVQSSSAPSGSPSSAPSSSDVLASSATSTTSSSSSTITASPSSSFSNISSNTTTLMATVTSSQLNSTTPTATSTLSNSSTLSYSPAPTNATLTRALAATPTSCAAKWLAPSMVTGTGTLPKPTSFVKRMPTGLGLGLDGASWRISGVNIYWLCNTEDPKPAPVGTFTSKTRIREALAIAVAMGSTTIRLISCGTSVNYAYAIEPKLGSFNQQALQQLDYVLYAAREYGLRVILPLTDNYQYYHGGRYDFLSWRGISTANFGSQFYTNNLAIASYKSYILNVITRVNSYTGVKYSNDPTILAWETGNELGAYKLSEGAPPLAWTKNIATYIKSLAPNHLVIDGSDGFIDQKGVAAPGVLVDKVDIMSDHAYPRDIALVTSEIAVAKKYNKGFLIGEWDWRSTGGGDTLPAYIRKLESHYYLGSLIWSIQGHDDTCCAFIQHNDGYSMYYPNGNSAVDMQAMLLVVQHYHRMSKRPVPTVLPGVACPQPAF